MRAMLALLTWSLLVGGAIALLGCLSGAIGSAAIENLLVLFGIYFVTGYVVLMVFAVPIYTWCSRYGRAGWTSVILIGAAPGLAILLIRVSWFGLLLLLSGLVVAVATHLMVVKDIAAQSNIALDRAREG